jgi:hypothetical protein
MVNRRVVKMRLWSVRDRCGEQLTGSTKCESLGIYDMQISSGVMPSIDGYTAVEKRLSSNAFFTGLPRRLWLKRQGSSWMFMGKKPERGSDFGKQMNLVLGFPIHKFSKGYVARNPEAERHTTLGGARCLEFHARRCELKANREPRYKKPVGETKASEDILIMVEFLVKDYQGKPDDTRSMPSSLEKLRVLKLAIEKDEDALAFDVMDLYLRCIRLLREIQRYALANAPHDYPVSTFTGGLSMNSVVGEMLYDLGGKTRRHGSIFPAVSEMVRKVIDKEGNTVLTNANMLREDLKLKLKTMKSEDEPSFENPDEDMIGLDFRSRFRFGRIALQDANGDCRMPFGPPV